MVTVMHHAVFVLTGDYLWMSVEEYSSWKGGGFIAFRLPSSIHEGGFYVSHDILLPKITYLQSKHSSSDYLGKCICRCCVETASDPRCHFSLH